MRRQDDTATAEVGLPFPVATVVGPSVGDRFPAVAAFQDLDLADQVRSTVDRFLHRSVEAALDEGLVVLADTAGSDSTSCFSDAFPGIF